MRTEESMTDRVFKEFQHGSRYAKVELTSQGWTVYVGYRSGSSCPGEEILPARWFKGFSTCSATYKREAKAMKEAERFVNKGDLK
jgi:hypothetical protein